MNKQTRSEHKATLHIGDGNPIVSQIFSHNAKCRCGSGKKTKHCCGNETKFFNSKPTKSKDSGNMKKYYE